MGYHSLSVYFSLIIVIPHVEIVVFTPYCICYCTVQSCKFGIAVTSPPTVSIILDLLKQYKLLILDDTHTDAETNTRTRDLSLVERYV